MLHSFLLGKSNHLKIARETEPGFYLVNTEDEEVLLPNAYKTESMQIGDFINVFVYTDSEDRLVASTLFPFARLGEFALLEVVDTSSFGAFVDWGLPKNLLVPQKYQKSSFRVGQQRVIFVVKDELTNRLIGVEKFGKFLPKGTPRFEPNQEVNLFILAETPLGFKAIINNRYEGMLFNNEIFENIEIGERRVGYIKNVRKDGKTNLSLQPIGKNANAVAQDKLLQVLRENDYKMPYNTKSDPQVIYNIFGLSKKSFKESLNNLIKEGLLEVNENGITLKNH